MSKIVIFTEDQNVGHYFESLMTTILDNECELTHETSDIMNTVSEEIALVLVDYNSGSSHEIIDYLRQQSKAKPLFIVGDKESLWQAKKKYKTKALQEYVSFDTSIQQVEQAITKMLKASSRTNKKQMYCRVNISFFYSAQEVFCDVYIKLKDKYVKVFNRYDSLCRQDLDKYKNKNVAHLYVKERDFQYITKQLVKQLRTLSHEPQQGALIKSESTAVNTIFSIQLQETVSESIKSIGINEDAVEMASMAITSTLTAVEENPKIYEVLQTSLQGNSYISEHSFLLSYIACAVCKEIEIPNQDPMASISLAAFFHDIALDSDDKAKVQAESDRDFERLGVQEQQEVLEHIDNACDILREIEGVPHDALILVLQHHERYDGTGFPRGIDYRRINPLAAVFNVCHELALYICESGGSKENVNQLIKEMELVYKKGCYRLAIEGLKKVFSVEPQQLIAS